MWLQVSVAVKLRSAVSWDITQCSNSIPIFRDNFNCQLVQKESKITWLLDSWRWDRWVVLICRYGITNISCFRFQKGADIKTAVRKQVYIRWLTFWRGWDEKKYTFTFLATKKSTFFNNNWSLTVPSYGIIQKNSDKTCISMTLNVASAQQSRW